MAKNLILSLGHPDEVEQENYKCIPLIEKDIQELPKVIEIMYQDNIDSVIRQRYRKEEKLTPSEALFLLFDGLSQSDRTIKIGRGYETRFMIETIEKFCKVHNLELPEDDWMKKIRNSSL